MKTIAVIVAMLLGTLMHGQIEKTGNISASVINVSGTEGNVKFGLYSVETFMKAEPNFSAIGKIIEGKANVTFKNVPEGTYAVLVMHDKNDNNQMDFDSNGMPLESYGSSGNSISYGPPVWDESKFNFDGDELAIEIQF
ncbi:DUF2141 domain-containing protein [Gramella sp. MAR_2010_147]|uniref:DUF2141 domain-containing protein n=1 Tax=Gramella sp. MAR_2010_147 TaxID=1250205 RepID=UPI00087C4E24|nr:DUF2141 domain-containing protein [Gramella sp. MAR_2010_147]SDR89252.1 Uncharacterized conserved protein, DUF2141 family [Gramella sp. MAR_2010_147]